MVKLHSAVEYKKVPDPVTGKLDPERATYDECAAAIRMFAREIFSYRDEGLLNDISISYYMGGNAVIKLDHLPDEISEQLRVLLIERSRGYAFLDRNNPKNIEFKAVAGKSAVVELVRTIEDITQLHNKKHCLSTVVTEVQKEQARRQQTL